MLAKGGSVFSCQHLVTCEETGKRTRIGGVFFWSFFSLKFPLGNHRCVVPLHSADQIWASCFWGGGGGGWTAGDEEEQNVNKHFQLFGCRTCRSDVRRSFVFFFIFLKVLGVSVDLAAVSRVELSSCRGL